MWCTSPCRVFWSFRAAPTASFARAHVRAFPEYTQLCDLPPVLNRPYLMELKRCHHLRVSQHTSPTSCLNRMLQTAATALHLITEALRHIARNRVSHRFHTQSFENKLKIVANHSATGAALPSCDFFLLLTVLHLFHILFCLDGSCLCLFCLLLLKGHLDKCLPFKS